MPASADLLRALPAEGRGAAAPALEHHPRARVAGPGLRVGHLRRQRLDPRPHHHRHPADRPAHDAAADGPPDLRQPEPRRAPAGRRRVRRSRDPARAGDPRRHARRPDRAVGAAPRGPAQRDRAGRAGPGARRLLHRRRRVPRPAPAEHATPTSTRGSWSTSSGRARASPSPSSSSPAQHYFDLVDRVRALGQRPADHPGHHAGDADQPDPAVRRPVRGRAAAAVVDRLNAVAGDDVASARSGSSWPPSCPRSCWPRAPGLHFITMNRSPATREIYADSAWPLRHRTPPLRRSSARVLLVGFGPRSASVGPRSGPVGRPSAGLCGKACARGPGSGGHLQGCAGRRTPAVPSGGQLQGCAGRRTRPSSPGRPLGRLIFAGSCGKTYAREQPRSGEQVR